MQLAVIGDIGGHLLSLQEELIILGVDFANPESPRIPKDLQICSVGDLIHRGPDSAGVVGLVDKLMASNPGQWHQLAGNHEAQYLFDPVFKWHENLDLQTQATLWRWWDSGQMLLAACFNTEGQGVRRKGGIREIVGEGDLLITHAGLTAGAWSELGRPADAVGAAEAINALRLDGNSIVWAPGKMLGGPANRRAGVAWAEAAEEVYDSWFRVGERVEYNFNQVHGHSSAMNWDKLRWSWLVGQWKARKPHGIEVYADADDKQVRAEIWGRVVWGVDPQHGHLPQRRWRSLVLDLKH